MSEPAAMSFLTFLRGLANEGLIQLGVLPHPITGERAVNLVYARATLQLLEILQAKSEGNRTAEEDEYLRGVLTGLRERIAKAGG